MWALALMWALAQVPALALARMLAPAPELAQAPAQVPAPVRVPALVNCRNKHCCTSDCTSCCTYFYCICFCKHCRTKSFWKSTPAPVLALAKWWLALAPALAMVLAPVLVLALALTSALAPVLARAPAQVRAPERVPALVNCRNKHCCTSDCTSCCTYFYCICFCNPCRTKSFWKSTPAPVLALAK